MNKTSIVMAAAIVALGASNLYLLSRVRAIDSQAYESVTELSDRLSAVESEVEALQPEPSTIALIARQAEIDKRAADAGSEALFEKYRAEDAEAKRGQ